MQVTDTLPTDPAVYPPAEGDMTAMVSGDPHPATTAPMAPVPATNTPGTDLPVGVHPLDARSPVGAGGHPASEAPGEGDWYGGPQGEPGRRPFSTPNGDAFAVFQRAASDWTANIFTLGPAATQEPILIAGRRRGRVSLRLFVPTGAAFGVVIGPTQGEVQAGGSAGVTLAPGDPPVELPTEGAVYASAIGMNASGTVHVLEFFNPAGGGLGLSAS